MSDTTNKQGEPAREDIGTYSAADIKARAGKIIGNPAGNAFGKGMNMKRLINRNQARELKSYLTKRAAQRFRPSPANTAGKIGESIKLRRMDLGMTQVELAKKSGVGSRFVSELERGKKTAELGKVLDVLDALNLQPSLGERD